MHEAWPDIGLDPALFERRRAELAADDRTDTAELYIAIAIEARVPGAVAAFERAYFGTIPTVLGGRGATPAEIEETTQQVRIRLIAPHDDGSVPLIRYAGRGQLDGLVRMTAIRAFLNAREKSSREADPEDWLADLVAPELEGPGQVVAAAERRDIQQAIATAVAALASRERAILRMHFINGLGIDPIAKMLGVHRATAARQLAKIKVDLVERVRATLAERWGDADKLSRITSRIDLSLERLLGTVPDSARNRAT
jgi:RNA polymerase sigma-70 factor (ECF subfamily)